MMKYKEFVAWCNDRCCDGCWSIGTITFCVDILDEIRRQPFWKREKRWRELNREYDIVRTVVEPINQKIREVFGKEKK